MRGQGVRASQATAPSRDGPPGTVLPAPPRVETVLQAEAGAPPPLGKPLDDGTLAAVSRFSNSGV